MKNTTRALAVGMFLTALVAALLTACPALAQEVGLDLWHVPDLQADMANSDKEFSELERKGEIILRRTGQRAETVQDLIEGRITVEEAVHHFIELNRRDVAILNRVRSYYPGGTDEQRAGWQLVAHIRALTDPRANMIADETAFRLLELQQPGDC